MAKKLKEMIKEASNQATETSLKATPHSYYAAICEYR